MQKTNAARQADYRKRRSAGRENAYRLNLYLAGSQPVAGPGAPGAPPRPHHESDAGAVGSGRRGPGTGRGGSGAAPWQAYWNKAPVGSRQGQPPQHQARSCFSFSCRSITR